MTLAPPESAAALEEDCDDPPAACWICVHLVTRISGRRSARGRHGAGPTVNVATLNTAVSASGENRANVAPRSWNCRVTTEALLNPRLLNNVVARPDRRGIGRRAREGNAGVVDWSRRCVRDRERVVPAVRRSTASALDLTAACAARALVMETTPLPAELSIPKEPRSCCCR